jgi:hypothetical protein|tara:strand:+ start:283 stop:921 length:639 start_codon:yes stop_codon:yes gene_type:complete
MNLVKVNIGDLKTNPANPPQRVDKTKSSYKKLVSSITRAGQIEPITISSDNVIVNGTRRTTVMKELGNTDIYANRLNSNSATLFDAMFLECNVVEKISGAQWAWRFLQKAPVPKNLNTILKRLKKIGGIGCIRRLVDLNKSPVSFNAGLSMFRNYTGKFDLKTSREAIYWMLYVDSAYRMKWLISEFVPVQLLVNAVKDKKHISMKGHWDES